MTILSPKKMNADLGAAPVARREKVTQTRHGISWDDHYFWLKDQGYPKVDDEAVLSYLKEENAYFDKAFSGHQDEVDKIFEELKGRMQQDQKLFPYAKEGYDYWWAFDEGAQYRKWFRKKHGDNAAKPEVMMDEPARAEGKEFFRLGGMSLSPDDRYLAWSEDVDGGEKYTLYVKDLKSGELIGEPIEGTSGSPVWLTGGQSFLYMELSEQWRPYRVRLHELGLSSTEDKIVYEEQDDGYFVGVSLSADKKFVLVGAGDHMTSEVWYLPRNADFKREELKPVAKRSSGHKYSVEHAHGYFYILSNDTHKNFRLARAKPGQNHKDWEELVAGSDVDYLQAHSVFKDFLVLEGRKEGLDEIQVLLYPETDSKHSEVKSHSLVFPEQAYTAGLSINAEFETKNLRISYASMVTPGTVYHYDVVKQSLEVKDVRQIPSGYNAEEFETERLMIEVRDGVHVPVSLVYQKEGKPLNERPMHLYAYGAYGNGMSPSFSSSRLSLLKRGFVYAIAHIRGGDELGYQWYEDGKLEKRTNTFNDFVDVAKGLVSKGYSFDASHSSGKPGISISGGSAGGELMGAVLNSNPELWSAAVAHVPFVDVLNTMLDESLPLTPMEWPEWGNPIEDVEAFKLIQSYSPYDQVSAQGYPPIMITAGLNDPRVTYWEPAKWAAKLRHLKTDQNILLLKTNMGAGHGGKSGRFDSLRQVAEEYVFLLQAAVAK